MRDETRYVLCANCDACPEVVLGDSEVTIGEDDNLVHLSKEQWNLLVDAILRGDLPRLQGDGD